MRERYDVIVIGGGHAGTEAAAMAARLGARTLLLTQQLETIGQLSCNPAIGGIAKGTVAREVDALGGIMGRATDRARLHFRMLNRSKGPAVWAPRAQVDRGLYRRAVRSLVEAQPNLATAQGTVARFHRRGGAIEGVETEDGRRFDAPAVVLTAGTFLRGRIHLGPDQRQEAGRAGEKAVYGVTEALADIGLVHGRFKTGTPPRIDGRTVRYDALVRQDGDADPFWFSFHERAPHPEQRPCWLTWAGEPVQRIVREALDRSALTAGGITGRGPRYCPSIEDKVVKFPDAERHQVYLEPEGLDTHELYVNGLSTSLPADVQLAMLRAVPGLEQVRMTRPGYAIEYDYFPPTQLDRHLAVRGVAGLFFAGQINGTTGYEEAAGQGVVAGLNAAALALGKTPIAFSRSDAYLGVLVDDLVTRGVDEPYRLFTSRAEYRLLLRQDNALRRLLPLADRLGLLSADELRAAQARLAREEAIRDLAEEIVLTPAAAAPLLEAAGEAPLTTPARVAEVAMRPGIPLDALLAAAGTPVAADEATWAAIELRYGGYLAREARAADRLRKADAFELPATLDYSTLSTLSFEAREKLNRMRPQTLGQAGRIPGVRASDLQALLFELSFR